MASPGGGAFLVCSRGFATTSGQGKAASALFARISSNLCEMRCEPFPVMMAFVRAKISFCLVRAMVASLRGHRRNPPRHLSGSAVLAAAECALLP